MTWLESSPRLRLRASGQQGSRAIVALLPKKDDHGPLAQKPISTSLLPMVYKLWAAARGAILKEWFVKEGHASAWGQGKSKGADTAAWMAAAQAELASAGGYDAFAAYIDCEKSYDHISLGDLAFQKVCRAWASLSPWPPPNTRASATSAGQGPCLSPWTPPTVYRPAAPWPPACSICSCSAL